MKYVWEPKDVHSGLVVRGVESSCVIVGFFDQAFHGACNGWYTIRTSGEMTFLPDVPSVVTWLNGFGAKPLLRYPEGNTKAVDPSDWPLMNVTRQEWCDGTFSHATPDSRNVKGGDAK